MPSYRRHVPAARWGALTATLLLALTAPSAAQDEPAPPSMACVRGAPLPACGGFILVEAQGSFPLTRTGRQTTFGYVDGVESRLEWNLGYMVNVSPKWAVGGTLSLGTGAEGPLTGLRARARRWLGPELSLELGAGIVKSRDVFRYGDATGLSAEARLNVHDYGALFLRWDGVEMAPFQDPYGSFSDPGGYQNVLAVGVGAGSSWALKGSLVAAGIYATMIAILLSGYD